MRPEVVANFPSFTAQFEGRTHFLYLDVLGLVTTGVGNLVDPIGAALPLPWQINGAPATTEQIAACWHYVKSRTDLAHAGGFAYGSLPQNTIRLTDEAVDDIVRAKMAEMWAHLVTRWPDAETWPWQAQMALLSMSWAMGSAFAFPKFSACASARDWNGCASNCGINATGNPGVIPRNKANAALFQQAATDDLPPAA